MKNTSIKVTGTFAGLKSPAISGVAALIGDQVVTYTAAAASGVASSPPSIHGITGITGDLTNGVAVFAHASVAYQTGVGAQPTKWYSLPDLPSGKHITELSGDLSNGLVATDGTSVYTIQFSSAPPAWNTMATPPAAPSTVPATTWSIGTIAGDPTNGILLALSQNNGPSVLYWGIGSATEACACAWVPLTAAGSSLPVTKVSVTLASGSGGNGFVIFGDNQFYSLTLKVTPPSPTAGGICLATQTKLPAAPFTVTDITGDPTNGVTAVAGESGLIATTTASLASWTVVSVPSLSDSSSS